MHLFAIAVDDLFADPHLARDAHWRPGGTGDPISVRVMVHGPDRVGAFGETRLAADTLRVDVRVSEVPDAAEGDAVEINGASFIVQGTPLRDGERLVWRLELRPA